MSALGSTLNFGIRIGAEDNTRGAIASAIAGFTSFKRLALSPITIPLRLGRGGIGFLRDLNLGLKPFVTGIDSLIEKGTGLEAVRKSFESLTGRSSQDARAMARSLVDAANGTLKMSEAMQIANRGLASGLSFEQISVALDFISKKAITTGKSAGEALSTVITGLARGSTLFLDDFGILVDGVDGVRAAFDEIKGMGAFDALGPAAQKAEIVRAAISEMSGQMGKIGLDGTELVFTWQRIKNSVGNAMEGMIAGIARSKALKGALEDVRGILDGIGRHFDEGGSFKELLLGKGGSSGLLGIVGAGFKDIGRNLAAGFAGNFLHALANGLEGFSAFFGQISELFSFSNLLSLPNLIGEQFNKFGEAAAPLINALQNVAIEIKSAIVEGLAEFFASNRLTKWLFTTEDPGGGAKRGPLEKAAQVGDAITNAGVGGTLSAAGKGMGIAFRGFFRGIAEGINYLVGDQVRSIFSSEKSSPQASLGSGAALSPATALTQALGSVVIASTKARSPLKRFADAVKSGASSAASTATAALSAKSPVDAFVESLRNAGDKALAGADGFKLLAASIEKFMQAYGGNKKDVVPPLIKKDELQLTGQRREEIKREITKRKWKMRQRRMGNLGVRQRARKRALAEIEKLRGEGKRITPSDRRKIFRLAEEAEVKRKNDEDQRRIDELQGQLGRDDEQRIQHRNRERDKRGYYRPEQLIRAGADALGGGGAGVLAKIAASVATMAELVSRGQQEGVELRQSIKMMTGSLAGLVRQLGNADNEMAAIANKK